MIEIVNRQRKLPVDCEYWQKFTTRALSVVPSSVKGVTVLFISDRRMGELNRKWRGKRGTTDVLSFPSAQSSAEEAAEPTIGDIVISLERALLQATESERELEQEIAQLILHGLLHLCGYDHETDDGEMNRLELQLRRRLQI